MTAKISGVGYICPNCGGRFISDLSTDAARPCYQFSWPYPEKKCCHFNETQVVSELQRLTIVSHAHSVRVAR